MVMLEGSISTSDLGSSSNNGTTGGQKRKRVKRESSSHASMTKMIDGSGNAQPSPSAELEQQLMPTAAECSKLASVIRMLDKHGVGSEKLPAEAGVPTLLDALNPSTSGWPHSVPLLEFYLDLASSAVKARLSETGTGENGMHIDGSSAQTASASTSKTTMQSTDSASLASDIDQLTGTVKGLLEEVKDAAAARQGRKRVKQSGKPKYALHRSLGGSYDVFSSVMEDAPGDDKSWQQLGDTDLLAVYPTELAETSSVPRLGELNGPQPMTSKRAIELQPEIEPVSFLYYDPYQSFAPTYDSSTATLSYAQSVSLRESRQTVQAWDNRPLPPLPPEDLSASIRPALEDSIASIDPSLFSPDDPNSTIKPEEMKVYLRMLEDSQVIDKRLAENTQLLRVLQEAQWHRLRKANTKASEMEIKSAERLLESLTSLANARPRTPELSDSSSPFLANPAIAASIVQTKPRAYYGTLDKSNSKGIPDYVMVNEDSKAKKEGSSLAPPEMNRKGSSQGQKKSKKNAASTNKKEKDKNQVINGTAGSPTGQISESTPQPAQVKQETPAA